MEAPRATTPPQEANADYGRVVALIAAILAGEIVVANVAATIAALLLRLVPNFFAALPEFAAKAAAVLVGLMLASIRRGRSVPSSATAPRGSAVVLMALEELGYRARWAANAINRIADAEDKQKAVEDERRHFALHLATSEKRREGRLINAAAASTYGPLLSWHHGPVTARSRPHHVKADGANYRIDSIPEETGAFPGVLPHCKCYPGPPIPGARVMEGREGGD